MFYNQPRYYGETLCSSPYPVFCNSYYGNVYLPYVQSQRPSLIKQEQHVLKDFGPNPLVFNIEAATKQNNNYRTTLWTGQYLQMTLMSIEVGGDIGLEVHPNTDQFIRIEQGQGLVQMGDRRDQLNFQVTAKADDAILIPAGKWHNLTNLGNVPLKVYVIYAPPEHPHGTVHKTKADAMHL
ncbi:cupin domain-containing protein [Paenibacillus typhae]|nr:cupin domain-containing protein [Paenibacillus typhae]